MGNGRIIVGIDEAGYGPRLGPLVVALSAFRVRHPTDRLQTLLKPAADPSGPFPVDDSKKVYRSGHGLRVLERSVLAFRGAAASPEAPDRPREEHPWGLPWPPEIPVAATSGEVALAEDALRAALADAGVEVLAVRSRTVDVDEFNAGVSRTGSKARVLFDAAMELLEPWLEEEGELTANIDRHGGRSHYGPLLAERFPRRLPWIVAETPKRSAYRLRGPAGEATIGFEVGGDGRHLSTGLASMTAKYVRELHMRAFNAHFATVDPGLRPTAGYHTDANRWLRESVRARKTLRVPEAALVRVR